MIVQQAVDYPDQNALKETTEKLNLLPPLVTPAEVNQLRAQLADVAKGNRFLLQGGDCAELFEYCNSIQIENKLKVLLQMSLIIIWGGIHRLFNPVRKNTSDSYS